MIRAGSARSAVRTAAVALPLAAVAVYAAVERFRICRVPRLAEVARGMDALVHPEGSSGSPPDHPTPASIVTIGDSLASGVGSTAAETSLPGVLARLVADALGRPVRVRSLGVTGARAQDVRRNQVPHLVGLGHVDVVVVSVGANDSTHLTPPPRFAAELRGLCEEAHAATGAPVLLTGVPEFRCARAIGPPLRVMAWLSGQLVHERQRDLAARLDGISFVDVLAEVGADFRRDATLVADDGYHPSDRGAARLAAAMAPAVVAVLTEGASVRAGDDGDDRMAGAAG